MSWSAFPFIPNTAHEPRLAAFYPLTAPVKQLEFGNQLRQLHHLNSLGSARAGTSWEWVGRSSEETLEETLPEEFGPSLEQSVTVCVPARVKLKMAQAAGATGRSEDDLWAEAASNWLSSHAFDDEPLPPAPAGALAVPSNQRSWDSIDELLSALRRPTTADRDETQRAA